MADETNEVQKEPAVKSYTLTEDQIKTIGKDMYAKALDEVQRSQSPDAMKGIENANGVAAPAAYIKAFGHNPYEQYTDNFKGLAFARAARLKAASMLEQKHIDQVAETWNKSVSNDRLRDAIKATAMQEGTMADGGALINTTYGEFISLIRDTSVVRKSGVRSMPLVPGLTMKRQNSAGTAHYVGEKPSGDKTSKQSYGLVQIFPKKLMATTVLSNDLIRDAGPQADVLTRDDLSAVAGLRSDLAFIRGSGEEFTPKGMRYWTDSGNIFASAGTSIANVTTDLEEARLKVVRGLKGLLRLDQVCWFISPRTESYLRRLRDGNNNLVYKPEMDMGKLLGFPYHVSTQIPENLGGGTNESEIYLCAVDQHIIFENGEFELGVFRGAAYVDADGVQAGLSNDETVIQLIARHDFFQRYDVCCAIVTGVTYGA